VSRSSLGLVFSFGGSAAAALVGGLGSRRAPEIYRELDKPSWAPPAAIFGPVWTLLYASMGTAAWRLWRSGSAHTPLTLHAVQLVLNAAWPAAFFAGRSRRASLAIIAALDVAVAAEILTARRHDRLAGALLAPYLAWTLFATALNAAVRRPDRAT
jgi:tryptophan-rich sensory protein